MSATRITSEGPTLWEALVAAAEELGVEGVEAINALQWDYEREHFRGGAWSVKVSAEVGSVKQRPAAPVRAAEERPAAEVGSVKQRPAAPVRAAEERPAPPARPARPRPAPTPSGEVKVPEAHRWLRDLLGWFHNDGASISSRERGERVLLSIDGARDSKLLIGRDGKNLPAFQHLMDKAMSRALGPSETRVILDVDGYLGEREDRLAQETREAIDSVEDAGEPVRLREMNSYERRQVHQLVKEHGGLVSRSVGNPRGGFKSIEISLEKTDAE